METRRVTRERQLAIVEAPMFRVGLARARISDVLRTARGVERDQLCRADGELRDAQRMIAAWSGYPYARRQGR